jgi:hypothetical protein
MTPATTPAVVRTTIGAASSSRTTIRGRRGGPGRLVSPGEVYCTSPAEEPDSSRWRTDVVAPYTRKVA